MRDWNWPRIAKIITWIYCAVCLFSGVTGAFGFLHYNDTFISIGLTTMPAWLFNPIGAVAGITASIMTRNLKYLSYVAACSVSWLAAMLLTILSAGVGV